MNMKPPQAWRNRTYRWLYKSVVGLSPFEIVQLVKAPSEEADDEAINFLFDLDHDLLFYQEQKKIYAEQLDAWLYNTNLDEVEFIVTDLETTGSVLEKDEIFEIGAVKMVGGQIVDDFHEYVAVEKPIPPFIARMTRVNERALAQADSLPNVLARFFEFLNAGVFVAHNSEFDFNFIFYHAQKAAVPSFINLDLCTWLLSMELLPEASKYGLDDLAAYHKGDLKNRHSAFWDASMTASLLQTLLGRFQQDQERSLFDLLDFERKIFQTKYHPFKKLRKLERT